MMGASMTDSPLRLLVVNIAADAADELTRRLSIVADDLTVQAETLATGADLPPEVADFDLVVIDTRGDAGTAFRLFADIRRRAPTTPITVATASAMAPGSAGESGHDPTCAIGDALFLIDSAVTDAAFETAIMSVLTTIRVSRERWRGDLDAAHRELADLTTACSPMPLTASSRMLGGRPLRESAPERFKRMKADYRVLLDEALALRIRGNDQADREELQALADRLGTLNAGPRDVIDLHRLTIADIVSDQPPQKARAYIDEGRLVLIQLMGYLASFYRSLTWGGRRAPQPRSRPWASSS